MLKNRFTVHLVWTIHNRKFEVSNDLITDFPLDRVVSICGGLLKRIIRFGEVHVDVSVIDPKLDPYYPSFSPYKSVEYMLHDLINVLGNSLENGK